MRIVVVTLLLVALAIGLSLLGGRDPALPQVAAPDVASPPQPAAQQRAAVGHEPVERSPVPSEAPAPPPLVEVVCRVVRAETGENVPNAVVSLTWSGDAPQQGAPLRVDEQGCAKVQVPAGARLLAYQVQVDREEEGRPFPEVTDPFEQKVSYQARAGAELRLEVDDGGRIVGFVVDAANGAAVPGARVAMVWGSKATTCDRAGRFELRGLSDVFVGMPTMLEALVSAEGFCERRVQLSLVASAGGPVQVSLHRGVTISGIVRSDAAGVVPGAQVRAVVAGQAPRDGFERLRAMAFVYADEVGRFVLPPLPPSAEVELYARDPGHIETSRRLDASFDVADVELRMPRADVVMVNAVDPSGDYVLPGSWSLLWRTPGGALRRSVSESATSRYALVPRGRDVELHAYSGDLYGSLVVTGGRDLGTREVQLQPRDGMVTPSGRITLDVGEDGVLLLLCCEGPDGAPMTPPGMSIEIDGSQGSTSRVPAKGMAIAVAAGAVGTVTVPGYEPVLFRVTAPPRTRQRVTVRLQPSRP